MLVVFKRTASFRLDETILLSTLHIILFGHLDKNGRCCAHVDIAEHATFSQGFSVDIYNLSECEQRIL